MALPPYRIAAAFVLVASRLAIGFSGPGGHEGITDDAIRCGGESPCNAIHRMFGQEIVQFSDRAKREIIKANTGMDAYPQFYGAIEHFDDEVFRTFDLDDLNLVSPEGATDRLKRLKKEIIGHITAREPDGKAARDLLGQALHAVQDFYSHSNWVEMGHTDPHDFNRDLGRFVFAALDRSVATCPSSPSVLGSVRGTTTGYFPLGAAALPFIFPCRTEVAGDPLPRTPRGKCLHGCLAPRCLLAGGTCDGIHKDDPTRGIGYYTARALAVQATVDFIDQILDDPLVTNTRAVKVLMDTGGVAFLIDDSRITGHGLMCDEANPDCVEVPYCPACPVADPSISYPQCSTCFFQEIDDQGGGPFNVDGKGCDFPRFKLLIRQVVQTVRNTSAEPPKYVLVRFNDDDAGPPFVTTDADAFLAALDAVTPHGSHSIDFHCPFFDHCHDRGPENCLRASQSALVKAIEKLDDDSVAYLFSGGLHPLDAGLDETVSMMAAGKFVKINPVFARSYSFAFYHGLGKLDCFDAHFDAYDAGATFGFRFPEQDPVYRTNARDTGGRILTFGDMCGCGMNVSCRHLQGGTFAYACEYCDLKTTHPGDPWGCSIFPDYVDTGGGWVCDKPDSVMTVADEIIADLQGRTTESSSLRAAAGSPLSPDGVTPVVPVLDVQGVLDAGATKDLSFPVDGSVIRLSSSIYGAPNVTLFRPSGAAVTASDPGVTIDTYAGSVVAIDAPDIGTWRIHVTNTDPLTMRFGATVQVESTIGLDDFAFVEFGGRLAHESLVPIPGQPVATSSTALARLSGVVTTAAFKALAETGETLATLPLTQGDPRAQPTDFVGDVAVPAQPFRVAVTGNDAQGFPYQRLFPRLLRPTTVRVSLQNAPDKAPAGSTTTLHFEVQNVGTADTFTVLAVDAHGFITGVRPTSVTLASGASQVIDVDLTVPEGTVDATQVSVAVTASSTSNSQTMNTAIAHIAVLGCPFLDGCPPCRSMPQANCQAARSRKGSLFLRKLNPEDLGHVLWKWTSTASTLKTDLGDPIGFTAYALCVYDAEDRLRFGAGVPGGGTCAGRACWRESATGFSYLNPDATPDGITKMTLKSGAPGRARISVAGKGPHLVTPEFPLDAPVLVQLGRSDGSACWEARYSTPRRSDTTGFVAHPD